MCVGFVTQKVTVKYELCFVINLPPAPLIRRINSSSFFCARWKKTDSKIKMWAAVTNLARRATIIILCLRGSRQEKIIFGQKQFIAYIQQYICTNLNVVLLRGRFLALITYRVEQAGLFFSGKGRLCGRGKTWLIKQILLQEKEKKLKKKCPFQIHLPLKVNLPH